jgi:uncharacterized membrane protein
MAMLAEVTGMRGNWVVPDSKGSRAAPMRGAPSTAAIFGHPIHPMIVPYPIAFLTTALATDLAAKVTGDRFWARTSRWLLEAGIASGLAAGAVGAVDYFTIRRAREARAGRLHAHGNPVALALATVNLARRRDDRTPSVGAIALTAATVAVLGVTAWAGGELSYTHMIGVRGEGDQMTDEETRHEP